MEYKVLVCLCGCYIMCSIRQCVGDWSARYVTIQDSSSVTTHTKMSNGARFLDPWYTAFRIDSNTGRVDSLSRNWSVSVSFEPEHVYAVKFYQEDSYRNSPLLLHDDETGQATYFSFIPGILNVGSRITLQVTPVEPWDRFAIALMDSTGSLRPMKMKVQRESLNTLFCYETDGVDYEVVEELEFPFVTDQLTNITFIVISSGVQVYVNEVFYYDFFATPAISLADSLAIWFEAKPDNLYLHSLQMYFPDMEALTYDTPK